MTTAEKYEAGMTVAFGMFAVGLLWLFIIGVFMGFIAWMRSFIG